MEAPHSGEYEAACSSKDPKVHGNQIMLTTLKELRKIAPNAAILSSMEESDNGSNASETDTADENKEF